MPQNQISLPSFAKINWHLRIVGKREDGFHELWTIFQTVSLCDELIFEEAEELILTCDNPLIPVGETNLIVRAARSLQAEFGTNFRAKIHLQKRIPAPGGLGGGSSNAAVALLGLRKLWNLEISLAELSVIGARLGSDVPFFLVGGTADGSGRGTEIEPIADIEEKLMLVVTPEINVSTAEAFAGINAPRLTKFDSKSILEICFEQAGKLNLKQDKLKNDFEPSVFEIEPEIGEIKRFLSNNGASIALLSGSGASVFAVFDKQETRQATMKAIESAGNWRQFAVATISREQYRAALAEVF